MLTVQVVATKGITFRFAGKRFSSAGRLACLGSASTAYLVGEYVQHICRSAKRPVAIMRYKEQVAASALRILLSDVWLFI